MLAELIYFLSVPGVTVTGIIILITQFLVPVKKKSKTGFILFTILYGLHDLFWIFANTIESVPLKCAEFFVYYLCMWFILDFLFEGKGFVNLVLVYAMDFIYQAIGSILIFLIMGAYCQFDGEKIDQASQQVSFGNFLFLMLSVIGSVIVCCLFIRIMKGKINRFFFFIATLLTTLHMLVEAINCAESLYVVVPIICLVLVWGMILQDRKLREKEKQEKYYSRLEERQKIREEELAKIRHDLANHLSIISATKNEEYAKELMERIDRKLKTGNAMVDCLLEEKEKLCENVGILLNETLISISNSYVTNVDWVSLLSNVLDNAIESCKVAKQDKKITFTMERKGDYLILLVVNSKCLLEHPTKNHFLTTKQDKNRHGYGTQIIRDITRRYDGRVRYEDKQDTMEVHIILQAFK